MPVARAAVAAAPETFVEVLTSSSSSSSQCSTRTTRLIRLFWLAAEIVRGFTEGRHPPTLTPARLPAMDPPAC
jgi:hypothetical protein